MDDVKKVTGSKSASCNACFETTRHRLATEYIRALCDYQVKMHKLQYGRTATKLGRWATSSRHRWNFVCIMIVAKIDNQRYTITDLVTEMNVSRNSVNKILADALAEGWVEKTGRLTYQATDYVIDCNHDYLENYLSILSGHDLNRIGPLYRSFMQTLNV